MGISEGGVCPRGTGRAIQGRDGRADGLRRPGGRGANAAHGPKGGRRDTGEEDIQVDQKARDAARTAQDERQEVLKDLFQAQVQGDLQTFYVEHVMADRADQPEKAAKYLDMDADEWADRKDQWAEKYRDAGAGEEIPPRALAEKHVRDVFGVDLDEFEQNVVEWDPGDVMRQVLAGNIRTARNGIRLCRESVEEGGSDE